MLTEGWGNSRPFFVSIFSGMKKIIKRELKSPSQWALGVLGGLAGLAVFLPEAKAWLPPEASLGVAVVAMVAKTILRQFDDR